MWSALLVFASLFALDFVWAIYTRAVVNKSHTKAATLASAIIVLSGTAAIGYTHDPLMLAPAALGAFGGTWCALRWVS